MARSLTTSDVVVIGGGIIGASAAALLAEAGADVTLVEERALAAGASGRNSGSLQHPFHPVLGRLHALTLDMYRELAQMDATFALGAEPAGLVLVTDDETALRARAASLAAVPELAAEILDPAALRHREPGVRDGLWGLALHTGYPVVPAAATMAYARRAEHAGAHIVVGAAARPVIRAGRVAGARLASGETIECRQLLVAAGPWTASLIPGWEEAPPIVSSWGLVVSVLMEHPPAAILEEIGIDVGGSAEPATFSLVTADGASSVGSTFLPDPPEEDAAVASVMRRARDFVPSLAGAAVTGTRVCARPLSRDGLPFVGPVADVDGLFVCVGHGPWGISTGPASSALVVGMMLGVAQAADSAAGDLSPDRLDRPSDRQGDTRSSQT
jgi:D-hydroxyproline dehydrogenase subunit beta